MRHALARYDTGLPYHIAPGPPLSDEGLERAHATAGLLARAALDRVVSSPARRCTETARPVAEMCGLDLQIDDDLGEMQPGEPVHEVSTRMLRATLAHVDASAVALVTHSAPIEHLLRSLTRDQVVLSMADGRGARVGLGHVWQLVHKQGGWKAYHLPPGGLMV